MSTQKSNQQQNHENAAHGKPGKAIVLVHGGFVDGSGWAGVHRLLKGKGYNVLVVQNPTKSLADDVAATKAAIDSADSEVVLVGHSYGGVVITEAGTHPKVSGLVYITAFAPDRGESVASLIANPPPGAPVPPILPPQDGYLFLDRAKFAAAFAADVAADEAAFMADSQVPWGVEALAGAVTEPAWKTKPCHYLVATEDKMIPPPRATDHGRTRKRAGDGSAGQPRRLCFQTGGGGGLHPAGRRSGELIHWHPHDCRLNRRRSSRRLRRYFLPGRTKLLKPVRAHYPATADGPSQISRT